MTEIGINLKHNKDFNDLKDQVNILKDQTMVLNKIIHDQHQCLEDITESIEKTDSFLHVVHGKDYIMWKPEKNVQHT